MADARLELTDAPAGEPGGHGRVPSPLPPDDPEAWYAPDVRAQYEVHPGVVVTVTEREADFVYDVREPPLTAGDERAVDRVESYFADAHVERPRTRQGAVERIDAGFDRKHGRVIDRLVVHTSDYAPAVTDLRDPAYLDRFVSERLDRHTVAFEGFEIPVVLYRENLLGNDAFTTKYAVREPDLLPGDEDLIAACKEQLWEGGIQGEIDDETAFVRDRAETLLARRLRRRNTRAWVDAARHRVRAALAEYDLAVPPVDRRYADDRLSDLVYYVLRDYVGYGKLTVPIRDPSLEDIEANRVGERVKVVPRARTGHDERVPTNLVFEEERAFVNVVTQLAAADGTELNASTPSAKVNLDPEGTDETIRCAVGLPTVSEGGPHISIRKQSADVFTPTDLVRRDALPTELVALLWLVYEHHGVVLFSGPTGVGKTTLMNA